jgi:hypothetical protein
VTDNQCASRDRECVFVKSRRGGKRIRKAAVDAVEASKLTIVHPSVTRY